METRIDTLIAASLGDADLRIGGPSAEPFVTPGRPVGGTYVLTSAVQVASLWDPVLLPERRVRTYPMEERVEEWEEELVPA